jgi:hypothetical protein
MKSNEEEMANRTELGGLLRLACYDRRFIKDFNTSLNSLFSTPI